MIISMEGSLDIKEQIIRKYFDAWILNNSSVLEQIFASEVSYSECYGPEYHGIQQVLQWFKEWQLRGKVLEWNIKRFVHQNNAVAVEWFFQCDYDNNTDGFDGVSIITFSADHKITSVKEFQSKAEHYYPYGK